MSNSLELTAPVVVETAKNQRDWLTSLKVGVVSVLTAVTVGGIASPAEAKTDGLLVNSNNPHNQTLPEVVFIVPHGDDEVTLLPLIQSYGDRSVVVIMTDGAATSRCANVPTVLCEEHRHSSTAAFLEEMAPQAELIWVGEPDAKLTVEAVQFWATNICMGECILWAAGYDYGHPDHNAVREAVAGLGGNLYDHSIRYDPASTEAVDRHYGWLGPWHEERIFHLGLTRTQPEVDKPSSVKTTVYLVV